MIYVFFIDSPDGGGLLRIVSDEPGSFSHRHVKLSFKAYVSSDLRSFDVKSRTWYVAPEAEEDFARWVWYAAIVCGAYFNARNLSGDLGMPNVVEHSLIADEWPEFI